MHYSQPLCSPEGDGTRTPLLLQPRLFWATLPNMGTSHWTPGLALSMAGEAPKGEASGRGCSALVARPQAQDSSSPSHPSLPVSWDIPRETQPSRSRREEGDFGLFLAWALGTEHLTMRASRKCAWQTSKGGKIHLLQPRDRDTRWEQRGQAGVLGPPGNPCSWQPRAPAALFCLDGSGAAASTSLPPCCGPRAQIPVPLPSWGCSLPQPSWCSCLRGTPIPGASLPPPPSTKPAPGTPFLSVLNGLSH